MPRKSNKKRSGTPRNEHAGIESQTNQILDQVEKLVQLHENLSRFDDVDGLIDRINSLHVETESLQAKTNQLLKQLSDRSIETQNATQGAVDNQSDSQAATDGSACIESAQAIDLELFIEAALEQRFASFETAMLDRIGALHEQLALQSQVAESESPTIEQVVLEQSNRLEDQVSQIGIRCTEQFEKSNELSLDSQTQIANLESQLKQVAERLDTFNDCTEESSGSPDFSESLEIISEQIDASSNQVVERVESQLEQRITRFEDQLEKVALALTSQHEILETLQQQVEDNETTEQSSPTGPSADIQAQLDNFLKAIDERPFGQRNPLSRIADRTGRTRRRN